MSFTSIKAFPKDSCSGIVSQLQGPPINIKDKPIMYCLLKGQREILACLPINNARIISTSITGGNMDSLAAGTEVEDFIDESLYSRQL